MIQINASSLFQFSPRPGVEPARPPSTRAAGGGPRCYSGYWWNTFITCVFFYFNNTTLVCHFKHVM